MRSRIEKPKLPPRVLLFGGLAILIGIAHERLMPTSRQERDRQKAAASRESERRAEQDRRARQESRASTLAYQYFDNDGEGRRLLDSATVRTIAVNNPYPDAELTGKGSTISSMQAGAKLILWWTVQDGRGSLLLETSRGSSFTFEFDHTFDQGNYFHLESDETEALRVAARLLASSNRGVVGLRVRRSDWLKEKEAIWNEYLKSHADVADEIGWSGSGPYPYLNRRLTAPVTRDWKWR